MIGYGRDAVLGCNRVAYRALIITRRQHHVTGRCHVRHLVISHELIHGIGLSEVAMR